MPPPFDADEAFMNEALALAAEAGRQGEVPVGAVAVLDGQIVGRGANAREARRDPLAHAELVALREASERLGRWRLSGVTLYVTLEPCPMCAGAIVNARVDRVVYGCRDPKAGAAGSVVDLLNHPVLEHRPKVTADLQAEPAATLLRDFFRARRRSRPVPQADLGED